jgi:hypothetical protein
MQLWLPIVMLDTCEDGSDDDRDPDDQEIMSGIEELIEKAQKGIPLSSKKTLKEMVEEEIENFFTPNQYNWEEIIDSQQMTESLTESDRKLLRKGNGETVIQFLDLLNWWERNGTVTYHFISFMSSVILSKHPSNAFMERVFSHCSYIDSNKYRRRLKDKKMECQVLVKVNRSIIAVSSMKSDLMSKNHRWMRLCSNR